MASYVYIIGSSGGPKGRKNGPRTYVGWTVDLQKRLAAHNNGTGAKSTRGRAWRLLYAERHATRNEAMRREWFLKRDRAFRKGLVGVETE